jgi:hypothetical protein
MSSIPENAEHLLKILKNAATTKPDAGDRFKLDNGQLARLSFRREKEGNYPRARVTLDAPRVEQAIIASLAALHGDSVEKKDLLHVREALLGARWYRQAFEASRQGEPLPEVSSAMESITANVTLQGLDYEYAEDLLRHYRSDFDDMPDTDQAALVRGVLEKTNSFLSSLRELTLYVQHGHPYKGLPNTPIKEAARDMRAAELKDIENLSYAEIGRRVDVGQTPSDKSKGDNTRVRTRIVPQGRAYFEKALGEEDYKEYVRSSKAERARRLSLERFAKQVVHVPPCPS